MPMEMKWGTGPGFARVEISGDPALGMALSALDLIAVETAGATRLLIDLRGVTTLQSFTDQYTLGQAVSVKLRHLYKVASLVPEERRTRNSERSARDKGLNLVVFESEPEAIQWLQA